VIGLGRHAFGFDEDLQSFDEAFFPFFIDGKNPLKTAGGLSENYRLREHFGDPNKSANRVVNSSLVP